MLKPFLQQNRYAVCRNWFKTGTRIVTSPPKCTLLSPAAVHSMNACSLMKCKPVCNRGMNCRGIHVNYAQCTPHPHAASVHAISNTLYWSLAVIDLISSALCNSVRPLYPQVVLLLQGNVYWSHLCMRLSPELRMLKPDF